MTQPLAFFLFLTAGIAATKRIPFDMPEGESEIIGYFVEYSGMKFGMFAMADFLETVVIAGMVTALFLGGWQVPVPPGHGLRLPLGRDAGACRTSRWWACRWARSSSRSSCMICFLMLIRWTLPRFRYDQAMRLGWLGLFPLSILNIVITAPGAARGGEGVMPCPYQPTVTRADPRHSSRARPAPAVLPARGPGGPRAHRAALLPQHVAAHAAA